MQSTPAARSLMQYQRTLRTENALTTHAKAMADKVIVKANAFQFQNAELVRQRCGPNPTLHSDSKC